MTHARAQMLWKKSSPRPMQASGLRANIAGNDWKVNAAPALRVTPSDLRSAAVLEFPYADALNLDEAKLHVPTVRPGSISRTALVNRLRASGESPVVTVFAPAGYGKTTLLAQWAGRERRSFAWVSVNDGDSPRSLLASVAAALGRADAIDSSVLAALDSRKSTRLAARRLAQALFSVEKPFVLVLDDVQLLRSPERLDLVSALIEHIPPGSTLVLAGRAAPEELPLARLRAAGRLFELGAEEISLSRRESLLVLHNAGVETPEDDAAGLIDRAEGWAAGLHLAALALQDGGVWRDLDTFTGADRYVADYFRSEYLTRLRPAELRFLTRTSVLETMSGPSCDAVLEGKGSARKLEALEKASVFVVPLDHRRENYRYHHLFRDLLRVELAQREPELIAVLNRRAARWCEANGRLEAAIDHATAAGETERVARLVASVALPLCQSGGVATVEGWLQRFDDERRLARYPLVAVLGAWVHAIRGRAAASERWLQAAEASTSQGPMPDGSKSLRPWLALLRAALCREGAERMLADADVAVRELGAGSPWRPAALLVRGAARLLLGDDELADEGFAEAGDAAQSAGASDVCVVALGERALLAGARGDHAASKSLGLEARDMVEQGGLERYATSTIELAANARAELRSGSWERARAHLEQGDSFRPELTHALPWYAVQMRLELARAHMTLLDVSETRALLGEIDTIMRRRPDLGVLAAQAEDLRSESAAVVKAHEGRASTLTPAELRLLPLLSSHLSFREIGERLYVSRNTVKTQAISVYRKLGVSSRSEAIARAADLGLLEPHAVSLAEITPRG